MHIALVGAEIEENLALRSIAASLEAVGHRVSLLDFHESEQVATTAQAIAESSAELVGLSMVFTARAWEFVRLARACRDQGFAGHLTAGGHFASLHAERLLTDEPALSSVIHGDGEEPMVELAAHLDEPEQIAGLTLRDASGAIHTTAARPNPDDLDARPWPRRPARFHRYLGLRIANLLSSRGCYARCNFCSIDAFHRRSGGRRFRQRSVEAVADEMAALYHDRQVRIFNFQDDNFFLPDADKNLERFVALERALAERSVDSVALQAKGRPDCIDEAVIDQLRGMGLFRLFLGIETDAVAGLRTLGRGMDRAHNHRALEILRRHKVHTCFNLLLFDPESTLETIRHNVDFMGRQDVFPLNFCRTEVYGGTPLEERLRQQGRLAGDYQGYTYRIADPRAQRAYELFRQIFWRRNFSFDGTHFLSMKLDYHLHLLAHFHPERVSSDLWTRAKGLVHELNRHSAMLMNRICDHAESSSQDDQAAVRRLVEELSRERSHVDEALRAAMDEVVAETVLLAAQGIHRRQFLQGAASTAAAAAVAAVVPACHKQTHMCEAPPPPPHDGDTHMCEAPPPPEPPRGLDEAQIEQIRRAIQQRIDETVQPEHGARFPAEGVFAMHLGLYGRSFGGCQGVPTGVAGQVPPPQLAEIVQAICQSLHEQPLELPLLEQLEPSDMGYQATIPKLIWPSPAVLVAE